MSSTKSRLRLKLPSKLKLICAFTALLALALAVGCRGFFPPNTYTSITIDPTTPSVPLNGNESLQLFGTNSNTGQNNPITSGASWSIAAGTTGSANVTNGGLVTGTAIGAITVNAEYQGLTATASGVVYLTNISSICVSTDNSSGSCSTSSEDLTTAIGSVNLYAIANYTDSSGQTQTIDITTSATWTLSNVSGSDASDVTCTTDTSPASCVLNTTPTASGTVLVTVSYPGTSITGTNDLDVSP